MKIIVVAPFFRPYENPRANRWSSIIDFWRKNGHEIQVITSRGFGEIEPEENVHRVGFNSLKEIFQHLFPGKINRGLPGNAAGSSVIYRTFNWLNNHFWRPFYWPDESWIWIRPARQKLVQLLDNQPVDLLITVGLPFSAHRVGLAAKQKYAQIQWLVDVGDPFNFQPFPLNNVRFFHQKNWRAEMEVLHNANQISVTNAGLQSLYSTQFGISKSKIKIVSPIFSGELGDFSPAFTKNDFPARFKIGYFGSFFQKIREPKILLDFLKMLAPNQREQLEIHFFGDIFPEFIPAIEAESLIKRHGLLPRKAAAEAMKTMDFLLNIGNLTDFQLPSKTIDYRLSGLPILNFCQIQNDTFANFMIDYPLIINILPQDLTEVDRVFTFLKNNVGSRVPRAFLEKWSAKYAPETIASIYLSGSDFVDIK